MPNGEQQGGANGEPGDSAAKCSKSRGPRGCRACSQHGKSTEHNPEPVLDVGPVGYCHCRRKGDRAPNTIHEPDRPQTGMTPDNVHNCAEHGAAPDLTVAPRSADPTTSSLVQSTAAGWTRLTAMRASVATLRAATATRRA